MHPTIAYCSIDLVVKDFQHPRDAGLAANGEPVEIWATDQTGSGAECQGFHHIDTASESAVHEHLGSTSDGVNDLW